MIKNSTNVDNRVDVFFKIICIGDSGTGKSHFLQTIHNRLNSRRKMKPLLSSISETIGIGFCSKVFSMREKKVKMHFWELSGQRRFSDIIETYFMNGNAILYFCSAEHPETIDAIGEWKEKIVTYKMGYSEFLNCRKSKNVLEQTKISDVSLDVPEMIILNIKDNSKQERQNIEKYTSILNNYKIPVVIYNGSLHSTYDVCDRIISILLDYYEDNNENEEYIDVGSNASDSDISKPLLKHSFSVDSISSITSSNECSYPSHHRLTVVEDNVQEIIDAENDQECSRCWFFNWCKLF